MVMNLRVLFGAGRDWVPEERTGSMCEGQRWLTVWSDSNCRAIIVTDRFPRFWTGWVSTNHLREVHCSPRDHFHRLASSVVYSALHRVLRDGLR